MLKSYTLNLIFCENVFHFEELLKSTINNYYCSYHSSFFYLYFSVFHIFKSVLTSLSIYFVGFFNVTFFICMGGSSLSSISVSSTLSLSSKSSVLSWIRYVGSNTVCFWFSLTYEFISPLQKPQSFMSLLSLATFLPYPDFMFLLRDVSFFWYRF